MNAAEIAKELGGHRNGSHGWLCRCPAHDDKSPSLSIRDGRDGDLKVRCFGGCEWADVKDALRSLGLLPRIGDHKAQRPMLLAALSDRDDALRRISIAKAIWRNAELATGTPVELYLRSRGFLGELPPTIRFHPSLRYPNTPTEYPGMVSAVVVEPSREIVAVHRTFLSSDGSKADVPQQKAMLGNCRGGAVRLAPAGETLIVGEGIETTLSAMQIYGLPGWAAMTASGIQSLLLPPDVRHVIVCADRDMPTVQHPRGHGFESADKARLRWLAEGRTVEVVLPRDGLKDFNDLLQQERFTSNARNHQGYGY